jgi:PhzF family phenazine biosynthesis protein
VPLCGHATLATANVLFSELKNQNSEVEFETLSGILKARAIDGMIKLDFPIEAPTSIELEVDMNDLMGFSNLVHCAYSQNAQKLLLHIENENELRSLQPNFSKLLSLDLEINPIGFIVTSETSEDYDFISRFFAPWVGVDEDPVTGSAHTVLYPYWKNILNKDVLVAHQASNRGGVLYLKSIGDDRVEIGGNAVTVFRGELELLDK